MDSQCPRCLGQAVMTLRLPCAIVESPWRHRHVPFVNIASLRSRSIKCRKWKHKLDYYGVVFAHLATGCGIKAKDPSGLDSDRWIPHSRCCENPARAKALAGFSRHLSVGFTDLNPAPRGLSLFLPPSWRHTPGVTHMGTLGLLTASSHCGDSSHFSNIDMYSHMPNRRAGQNIRSGWHISSK